MVAAGRRAAGQPGPRVRPAEPAQPAGHLACRLGPLARVLGMVVAGGMVRPGPDHLRPHHARRSRGDGVVPIPPDDHAIAIHLDKLLADRGMTLTELSERVGVSVVNLSILKNGRARAIRFSTLTRLCEVLDCQPGDLLSYDSAGA